MNNFSSFLNYDNFEILETNAKKNRLAEKTQVIYKCKLCAKNTTKQFRSIQEYGFTCHSCKYTEISSFLNSCSRDDVTLIDIIPVEKIFDKTQLSFQCNSCKKLSKAQYRSIKEYGWNCTTCKHLVDDPKKSVASQDEFLKLKGLQYSSLNEFPANRISKMSGMKVLWEPIDKQKHKNPIFWRTPSHVFEGKVKPPFPGYLKNAQLVCDISCTQCLANTWADKSKSFQDLLDKANIVLDIDPNDTEQNCYEPWQITKSTQSKFRFRLIDSFGHKNPQFVTNVQTVYNGIKLGKSSCPQPVICNPPQSICDENCNVCISFTVAHKTFVQQLEARKLLYIDEIPAYKTFQKCNAKRHFFCTSCNIKFFSIVSNIAKGRGCGYCKNKTQKKVFDFLLQMNQSNFIVQQNCFYSWSKNENSNRMLPFDIVISYDTEKKIIVEVDGIQHFQSGRMFSDSNINCHDTQRQKDTYKAWCAWKQGIPIIRIFQEDVYNDRWPEWKDELLKAIELAKEGQSSYLSQDKELYKDHQFDFEKAKELGCTQTTEHDSDNDSSDSEDDHESEMSQSAPKRCKKH